MSKKLDYNWAKDEVFARDLMANLLEIASSVQAQRMEREAIWQRSYRAWSIDKTEADVNYRGIADLKIPQLRKEVETMSRRIYKGLLPEDYLRAESATGFSSEDLANVNAQVVRHYYDNVMQIKKVFQPWSKQLVILGTSGIRQFWEKRTNEMFYKKREAFTDKQGVIRFRAVATKEDVTLYNAPKLRAEDMFTTWVYPHNANTPEDIEIVFSQYKVKKTDLEKKAKEGMCHGFESFKDEGQSIDHADKEAQERLAQFGDSGEFRSLQGNDFFTMLECWCLLVLPGSEKPVSCVVEIINENFCTRIQRNPYWHQQTPFDFGRFIIPPPGEFYGRGLPEAAMSLQLQLDDTMNQTMDATTLALNNITIVNPAYAPNSESFEIEPGATWWADPQAVKQFAFPDLSETGYRAAGTLRNWISEMSDNQPQLPDPIAGKARSTGQAQMAIGEWQTDLFNFIDYLSVECLNSMAFKTHSLLQQFLQEDDIIRVAGKYADTWINRVVTPADICGRYQFRWMGSIQIENQSVKTQQMLNLMQIYKNLPGDAQAQIKMRWPNYVVKLLRDGFMIKDVYNLIETSAQSASIEPMLEEKILTLGGDIEVVESDNDDLHITQHEQEALAKRGKESPVIAAKRAKHLEDHRAQKEKKALMAQQQAQMAQMAMLQQNAPGPQGGAEGNPTQIPSVTDAANLNRGIKVGTGS